LWIAIRRGSGLAILAGLGCIPESHLPGFDPDPDPLVAVRLIPDSAGSGAIFDLNSNALRPAGWTSADAAGLPILPGLARYDEVAAGEITHALRFTVSVTRRAYLSPARHWASSNTDPLRPPMGMRMRLKASFNHLGLPRHLFEVVGFSHRDGLAGEPWRPRGLGQIGALLRDRPPLRDENIAEIGAASHAPCQGPEGYVLPSEKGTYRASEGEPMRDQSRRLRVVATTALAATAAACGPRSPLLAPTPRDLAWVAPDSFLVDLITSRGRVALIARRSWSLLGVDRFHFLVRNGYYDGARFFRVVPGFVVQWGISGDTALNRVWRNRDLPDEPVRQTNSRGRVAYARGGPNTRGVQLYVNLADNARLDTTSTFGFPPIGEVTEGMSVMDSMFAGYSCRRGSPGTCPAQDSIEAQGSRYLARVHPNLDFIRRARVVREWRARKPE